MPENTVKGRRSIHDLDPNSSQRGKSVLDETTVRHHESQNSDDLNYTKDHINTDSGSDYEGFEADETHMDGRYSRRHVFDISRSPPMTPQRPKRSPIRNSPKPTVKTNTRDDTKLKNKQDTGKSFFGYITLVVVLLAIAGYYFWSTGKPSIQKTTPSIQKICSFEHLKKQFPQQDDILWRSLKVGIESILNKRTTEPGVYLFAHTGSPESFQLVKNITQHSSECFDQKMLAIEIENQDFITAPGSEDDYGHVIEKYKAKIKQGNVILIANLNEIPPKAARALHAICDTHSPIAEDVVIFLTLTIAPNKEGNAAEQAENTLRELWELQLADYELDALITRVTDQVFVLKS